MVLPSFAYEVTNVQGCKVALCLLLGNSCRLGAIWSRTVWYSEVIEGIGQILFEFNTLLAKLLISMFASGVVTD